MALLVKVHIEDSYKNTNITYFEDKQFSIDNINQNPLFLLNEKQGLTLSADLPKNTKLIIEDPSSNNIVLNSDNTLAKISEVNENEFVPGNYKIELIEGNTKKYSYFTVTPSNLDYEELENLREIINKFQDGLANDIFTKKLSEKSLEFDLITRNSYLIYRNLKQYLNDLKALIYNISKNPNVEIVKKYRIENDEKRQDRKTERWSDIKSDSLTSRNNKFLNIKRIQTIENSENEIIKIEIDRIIDGINMLIFDFNNKITAYNLNMEQVISNIIEIKSYILGIDIKLSKKIDKQKREVEYNEKNLSEIKEKIEMIEEILNDLIRTKHFIYSLIENTWINKFVSKTKTVNRLKAKNFHTIRLIQLSDRIFLNNKSTNSNTDVKQLQYRNTPYLFEVFTLLTLHKVIIDNGYQQHESEIFQKDNGFIVAIRESILTYSKDEIQIELRYDKTVPRYITNNNRNFYNLNASHNKPDFLVAIYKNSQIIDSFIVEAKCVKQNILYSNFEETKLTEQFKDYLSFTYVDVEKFMMRKGIIRKVMVVHPDKLEQTHITEFGQIEYLGVDLRKEIQDLSIYKYFDEEINYVKVI